MSIFGGFHKKEKEVEEKKTTVKKAPVSSKAKKSSSSQMPAAKKVTSRQKTAPTKTTSKKVSGKQKEEKLSSSASSKIKKTERPAITFHFPHISEKATILEEEGKYVFRVNRRSNKVEIKKAFEEMHRVKVVSVRIINIPRKKRDWRGKTGYQPGYKKAIIKVEKDHKVNIH